MTRSEWMRRAGLSATLLVVNVPVANALDIELGAGVEAEYTTNVLRTDDAEDDLIGTVWGGISLIERSPTLNAQVAAAADARTYLNDTVSDDVLLSLASVIDWAISPQRFVWHLEDYYQQTQVSPLEPNRRDNQQDTNVFWTGPDLILRLAQLYTIRVGARYGNYYYEDTDDDNERLAGSIRATRRLSTVSEIYVEADQMQVEYDRPGTIGFDGVPNTDFDRTDAFAGWAYQSPLTEMRVEFGATRIQREGLDDADGPLAALFIRRQLPQDSAIGLRLMYRYTEGGGDLLSSEGGRMHVDSAEAGVIQDIVYERFLETFYDGRWGGADVGVRVYRRDEDYEEAQLDRLSHGVRADAGFRLAPAWRAGLYVAYRHRDYDQLDRRDHDLTVGTGASYLLTRRITADFDLHHNARDSTLDGSDFNETVGMISLRYGARPAWSER